MRLNKPFTMIIERVLTTKIQTGRGFRQSVNRLRGFGACATFSPGVVQRVRTIGATPCRPVSLKIDWNAAAGFGTGAYATVCGWTGCGAAGWGTGAGGTGG
jgi:hypothetical protein